MLSNESLEFLPLPEAAPAPDYTGLPDQALNELAQNGDNIAFAVLYGRHNAVAQNAVRRHVADVPTQDPEDIAHEAAIRLWNAMRGENPPDFSGRNAEAWMARVAKNIALDGLRRRTRYPEDSLDAKIENDPWDNGSKFLGTAEAPDSEVAGGLEITELLAQLPPAWREPLKLYALHRYQYDEIAAMLGIPVGTVKSQINRAKRDLRKYLEDRDTPATEENIA